MFAFIYGVYVLWDVSFRNHNVTSCNFLSETHPLSTNATHFSPHNRNLGSETQSIVSLIILTMYVNYPITVHYAYYPLPVTRILGPVLCCR